MNAWSSIRLLSIALAISMLASGCYIKELSGSKSGNSSARGTPTANRAPTISGSPPTSLVVGRSFDFRPTASDADGDALNFSIQNRPQWATFDSSTGRLQGTPGAADVGQFTGVTISVSDGRASARLNAFTVSVSQIAMGNVTLSWTPPTTNADGSAIADLAGYRIYFGRSAGALNEMAVLNNAGLTRYVLDNLSPATWYFSMTSYNSSGIESARSSVVSKTVT